MPRLTRLPETTIRLGCEDCSNKQQIKVNMPAFCLLVGINTENIPIKVEETCVYEAEYEDGSIGLFAADDDNPSYVERVVKPDCADGCKFESEIEKIGHIITSNISLAGL